MCGTLSANESVDKFTNVDVTESNEMLIAYLEVDGITSEGIIAFH